MPPTSAPGTRADRPSTILARETHGGVEVGQRRPVVGVVENHAGGLALDAKVPRACRRRTGSRPGPAGELQRRLGCPALLDAQRSQSRVGAVDPARQVAVGLGEIAVAQPGGTDDPGLVRALR